MRKFKSLYKCLVPTAAVTPATITNIEIVVVKKFVVGFLLRTIGPPRVGERWLRTLLHLTEWCGIQDISLEEIRMFQAGARLEYSSSE